MRPHLIANAAVCLAVLAVLLAGCGGDAPVPPADRDVARRSLTAALDAWKRGERAEALAAQSPPVRVADDDWLAGATLQDFALGADDRHLGHNLNCPVELKLRTRQGKAVKKAVVYLVTTEPAVSITRQETP